MGNIERKEQGFPVDIGRVNHLKWPLIIMVILLVILVVLIDYCTRTGKI